MKNRLYLVLGVLVVAAVGGPLVDKRVSKVRESVPVVSRESQRA
jgi:hypothetical protein